VLLSVGFEAGLMGTLGEYTSFPWKTMIWSLWCLQAYSQSFEGASPPVSWRDLCVDCREGSIFWSRYGLQGTISRISADATRSHPNLQNTEERLCLGSVATARFSKVALSALDVFLSCELGDCSSIAAYYGVHSFHSRLSHSPGIQTRPRSGCFWGRSAIEVNALD